MKYLGINLTKEVKDCILNYKTFMKDTEGEQIHRKISCGWRLEESISLKCPHTQTLYRSDATPIKIPMNFFKEIQEIILKLV